MAVNDFPAFFLLVAAALGMGRKISRRFLLLGHPVDALLVSCAIGFGCVSFGVFLLGIMGFLYPAVLGTGLFLCVVLTFSEWMDALRAVNAYGSRERMAELILTEWCCMILFLAAAGCALLVSLTPSLVWDELHYHLPVPDLYLRARRMAWLPYLPYSNFPLFMEMLYLPALALGTESAANFVHGFFALLTAVSVYRMASFFFSRLAGAVALAAFSFVPMVMAMAPTAYVDFGFTFYGMISLYFLLRGMEEKQLKLLWLSSVLLGLAFCTKYSAVYFYGIFILFLLHGRLRGAKPCFITLPFLLAYASLPVVFLAPYFLKNWIFTGNPVYPFLYSVFGGKGMTLEESRNIVASITGFGGMGKTFYDLLMAPWNLTMQGQRFFGNTGPLFLACLPAIAAVAFSPDARRVRPFLFFSIGYLVLWFYGTQQMRFLFPFFAGMSVVIGYLYDRWAREKTVFFAFAFLLLLAHAAIGLVEFFHFKDIPVRFYAGAGAVSRENYLRFGFESFEVFRYANAHLNQKHRVFLVNDNRNFYLRIPALPSSGAFMLHYETKAADKERYRRLQEHGVTHMILNGVMCWASEDTCRLVGQDAKKGYLLPVFEKNGVFLFKVRYENISAEKK